MKTTIEDRPSLQVKALLDFITGMLDITREEIVECLRVLARSLEKEEEQQEDSHPLEEESCESNEKTA